MFFIDRSLYSSWDYILKNSIDPAFLMETFTVTHNNKLDELKPGGAEILIDDIKESTLPTIRLCCGFGISLKN